MPTARLHLHNHQSKHRPRLRWLKQIAQAALHPCMAAAKSHEVPLRGLEEIEISFISDEDIARVHGEFLNDPTPTDVITFHHGEILISADTALNQGMEHGQSLDHELALYLVHGLMHLGGWDDHEPAEADEMARIQDRIWRDAIAKVPD
jgi:probable rRNA maturation factor